MAIATSASVSVFTTAQSSALRDAGGMAALLRYCALTDLPPG
jgi:hypothetical protein